MERREKNLLVIAYFYPPHKGIGGKRIFRLIRGLPSRGWRPSVLTTPEPPAVDRDLAQPAEAPGVSIDRGYVPGWIWRAYHGEAGGEYRPGPLHRALSLVTKTLGVPVDDKLWF